MDINEHNTISLPETDGQTALKALEDVNLITREGLGGGARGSTDGMVISISGVPYGAPAADGTSVSSTNTVTIEDGVQVEAGINNKTFLHVLPLTLAGADPQDRYR